MEASRIGIDKEIHENALLNYGKLSYESAYYTAAVSAFQDYLKHILPVKINRKRRNYSQHLY